MSLVDSERGGSVQIFPCLRLNAEVASQVCLLQAPVVIQSYSGHVEMTREANPPRP